MRRRRSERLLGKLLFGAFMMFVRRVLEPVPILGAVLDIVALAA